MPGPEPSLPPLSVRPHPHLLEIPTWAWLEELSQLEGRRITLGRVPEAEWDRIQRTGFDLVWLMGVWKRSPGARGLFRGDATRFEAYDRELPGWKLADLVGSPYAVQDYHPDPRIGTWQELDGARRKLRERGMGLILDFVGNHTALDHEWVSGHPEYYVEGSEADFRRAPALFSLIEEKRGNLRFLAHGRDPYFPPWGDTAQLNHFVPGLREALLDVVRQLARHADGLRCDMAMLALNDVFAQTWEGFVAQAAPAAEFWQEAIGAAPKLVWLAEAYWGLEGLLQELGFAYTYDKAFYDHLKDGAAGDLRRDLEGDLPRQQRRARFLENHDEQRAAAVFGPARIQAAATLAATAPGLRFYFHGQLDGRKIHYPIEMARAAEEPEDTALRALYEHLLRLSDADVFHDGRWRLLESAPVGDGSYANLVAYEWRKDAEWRLVAANPTGAAGQARVALGDAADPAAAYLLDDRLNGALYERTGQELVTGLYIRLDPGRAHLFEIHRRE